jgi:casein kinase I family protein HRR25
MNRKYKLLEPIGSGSFGSVYKGQNNRTGEHVAIKVEAVSAEIKLLRHESVVYQYLKDIPGIPSVRWFGRDGDNYYMVINLLGESLEAAKQRIGCFSLETTISIGIKALTILKSLHEKHLIHRDIKPANFVFGVGSNDKGLYIIDFGFCKSFTRENRHVEQTRTNSLIGSLSFASVNAHDCVSLSRRDDLESLGYLLLYLNLGRLPWQDETLTNDIIRKIKHDLVYDTTIPKIFTDYFTNIRSLGFTQRPDYLSLIDYFKVEMYSC